MQTLLVQWFCRLPGNAATTACRVKYPRRPEVSPLGGGATTVRTSTPLIVTVAASAFSPAPACSRLFFLACCGRALACCVTRCSAALADAGTGPPCLPAVACCCPALVMCCCLPLY